MSDWMFEPAENSQSIMWGDPVFVNENQGPVSSEAFAGDESFAAADQGKGELSDFDLMLFSLAGDDGATELDDVVVIGDRNEDPWWDIDNLPGGGESGGPSGDGGQSHGGSGGGYRGGATPDGFTPHEDGTGRFMYDAEGNLHINPNYQAWLQHNDQRIDWAGVAADLAKIVGPSYGTIAVGALRAAIGGGIAAIGEWISTQNRR